AEYRLLLREDNADVRLLDVAHRAGAIDDDRYRRTRHKSELAEAETARLEQTIVSPSEEINARLRVRGTAPLTTATPLAQLLRRPELSYADVTSVLPDGSSAEPLPADVVTQVEVTVKYSGYVKRQQDAVDRFKRLEGTSIPEGLDYDSVTGLS